MKSQEQKVEGNWEVAHSATIYNNEKFKSIKADCPYAGNGYSVVKVLKEYWLSLRWNMKLIPFFLGSSVL
jgi:hypothetical protein